MKNMLIVCLVVGLLLVLLLRVYETTPLERVALFGKNSLFLYCSSHLFYLDISTDSRFHTVTKLFTDYTPIFPGAPTAITGDSFYVGADNVLYEFDPSLDIRRQIAISEFGFDPAEYSFSGYAYAFKDLLWITAKKQSNPEYRPQYYFVIQWDTATSPETRKVSPTYKFPGRWTIDPVLHMLYVPGRHIMYHNFDTGETEFKDYGFYAYADYRDHQLLLSGMPEQKNYPITLLDLRTQQTTFLDTGAIARWGNEGTIYYSKGTTKLWKMELADRQPQPLYQATRFTWYWPAMSNIEVSESGRYLSFVYAKPKWLFSDQWRFIIVDLQDGTYRTFPRTYIGTFSVALWESDQMNHRNKQIQVDDTLTD